MRAILATLVLMLVAVPVTGTAEAKRDTRPTVVIHNDDGGVLHIYNNRRKAYRDKNVQIAGYCYSVCTLFLSLPHVCVDRNAELGFHAGRYSSPEAIAQGTLVLAETLAELTQS